MRDQQVAAGRRVVEQFVAEALPPLVEPNPRLDVVVDLERRREPRLERVLGQDAMGEAVQRRDRRGVELLPCSRAALALAPG